MVYDQLEESYVALAEEASCEDAHPWNDEDWDEQAVSEAKIYAAKHDLPWPPGLNDFDNWYDQKHNP